MGVIAGVHGTDNTRQRLTQRCRIKTRTLVRQEATHLHHLGRNDDVSRVAADESIGISRSGQQSYRTSGVVEGRLDGELVSRLELILPLGADLNNLSGELVTDDRWILGDVVRNPLVIGSLMGRLVGRHAKAVADNLGEDLVILHPGELELLETKVIFSI